MKKSLVGLFGVLGLVAGLSVSGCGSDSKSNGNNSGALTTSCNAYCDAYIAKACADPIFTSAADCKTNECGGLSAAPAGACQNALKVWYDCRTTEADICMDNGCDSQNTAWLAACPAA